MDMMKMMKQAADLQKNLKKKQKDLAKTLENNLGISLTPISYSK